MADEALHHQIPSSQGLVEPWVGNKIARQLDSNMKVYFAKGWAIYRLHCYQLYGIKFPFMIFFGRICATQTLCILCVIKDRTTLYLFHS